MSTLRLLSFYEADEICPGIAIQDRVYEPGDLGAQAYASVLDLLNDWDSAHAAIKMALVRRPADGAGRPLHGLRLAAPLAQPGAIFCAGANYRDHVANMSRVQNLPPEPDPHELGLKPWHFMKTGHCVAGPDATVISRSKRLDWEAELAVVIGRRAKEVSEREALEYVAGYTIANDLSARDRTRREGVSDLSPFKYDWIGHKNFDGSCPFGPWIVPASQIGDPQALSIKLWVNNQLRQDSCTDQMIFTIAEQIAHLSQSVTLHPGDMILTGTPAGTGTETGERLQAGDEIRIAIQDIGELVTRIG